jgi:hypothetical protein
MSDLEKFVELYKSVGIEIEPYKTNEFIVLSLESERREVESAKIKGFASSEIVFDANEKFLYQRLDD